MITNPKLFFHPIPSVKSLLHQFFISFKLSYIEWIITIGTLLLVIIPHSFLQPDYTLPNISLIDSFFPYTSQTFPTYLVIIVFIIIPYILLILFYFLLSLRSFSLFYYENNSHFDLNYAALSLFQTLGITILFTEFLKVYVSRPRPNFFSYCGYNSTLNKCTGSAHDVRDSHISFPSGHSSISFSSSVWILLFLRRMRKSERNGQIWYIYIQLFYIILAAFCASSRIVDHMHHPSDVITGTVMGISFAYLIFQTQSYRIFDNTSKDIDSTVSPINDENDKELENVNFPLENEQNQKNSNNNEVTP